MAFIDSLKNFGKVLASEKSSAVFSAAATAAVTYLGKKVEVLTPVFNLNLFEGAGFGFVVNEVSKLSRKYIFTGNLTTAKELASFAVGGLAATGASHAAVHLGLSAAAVTPAGAIALTIAAVFASKFAPSDKQVSDLVSQVLHAPGKGYDWVKAKFA